jgi:choline dehydrogenase-like flavoprotein
MPVLLHPKSVGEILLRSSNPEEPPLIQPNYLTHPYDVETLYHGTAVSCLRASEAILNSY